MTTPDPADNGSRQPRDQSGEQPEREATAHPSGVPAGNAEPWASAGDEAWTPPGGEAWTPSGDAAWAPGAAEAGAPRDDSERWAPTDDPEQWASAVDPAPPPPLPSPLDNSRSLGDEPLEDPTPRTMLNGTPLTAAPTISGQAAGSSPDETPTAPQPTVPTPGQPTPGAPQPGAPAPGQPTPIAPTLGTPVPGTPEPDKPPPWSTPDTPATAPPIGGTGAPSPAYPQPPFPGEYPPSAGPPPPSAGAPPPGPHPPTPPGGSAPPYPPGPPLPPPKRNGRLPLILGIIAILLLCCCAAVVTSLLTWGDNAYDEIRDWRRQTIGLGEPGRDGNLEFRVAAVECGIGRLGDPFVSQAAVGQYCLVEVTVRNIGNRPAALSESLQKAYGPAGKQFVTDSGAVLLANSEQPVFLTDINPGNQVTGILVYDIPPDARIIKLELHASDESRGLIVKLG